MISKQFRAQIYEKFGGRCAYCGRALNGVFHVDHIVPVRREQTRARNKSLARLVGKSYLVDSGATDSKEEYARIRALTTIEQVHPACRRCNNYKSVLSLEDFRIEIARKVERARRYSLNFRLAEDYGLIKEIKKDVRFYFESV